MKCINHAKVNIKKDTNPHPLILGQDSINNVKTCERSISYPCYMQIHQFEEMLHLPLNLLFETFKIKPEWSNSRGTSCTNCDIWKNNTKKHNS